MKLYNTLEQRVMPVPQIASQVKVYACGITPYDTTHLGHAFTYSTADLLIRYLEFLGSKVIYVQNVTDIDDDILKKAAELSEDWRSLGNRWTTHFIEDMKTLNVRPPDHFPRATDVIPQIVETVLGLLKRKVAYEREGNVYYDINSWEDFGKLSRLTVEKMLPIANERGNDPDDPHKDHPLDFVLWQAKKSGEPAWESPWGSGRPGWHIECSTMATQFLGESVDIHIGGNDLLFPHHECEIAQVEPLTEKRPFVKLWMHVAMVHHEDQKMSKSLGNLVMIRDLLKSYTPDAIRLYLASHHYREIWNYEPNLIDHSAYHAEKLKEVVKLPSGKGPHLDPKPWFKDFIRAMNDDLNTPLALQSLYQLRDHILSASESGQNVIEAQHMLRKCGGVLGLHLDAHQPETAVITGWDLHMRRFADRAPQG
jgi:L-cysteine:1D-myo-inositol 2-amino-2-deoxy-alpha-D-glucopyranoside ligase